MILSNIIVFFLLFCHFRFQYEAQAYARIF